MYLYRKYHRSITSKSILSRSKQAVLHCHYIGLLKADYAVWALLIVEGSTVTYSC